MQTINRIREMPTLTDQSCLKCGQQLSEEDLKKFYCPYCLTHFINVYRKTIHICNKKGKCEFFKYHGPEGWKCGRKDCEHVIIKEIGEKNV